MTSWQPPTEDEFNNSWFTRLDALGVSDQRMAEDTDKWAIKQRLQAGQILAVARTAQVRSDIAGVRPFVPVHTGAWVQMDRNAEFYFWSQGDLVVPDIRDGVIHSGEQRFFDVRFDPDTFNGKPPPIIAMDGAPALSPAVPPKRIKEISTDEAERASRAIFAGWPEATEKEAYAKALALYPENKVPREWFLGIFRLIRGPRSRGVQPRIRD
jgi:hypothetical protein